MGKISHRAGYFGEVCVHTRVIYIIRSERGNTCNWFEIDFQQRGNKRLERGGGNAVQIRLVERIGSLRSQLSVVYLYTYVTTGDLFKNCDWLARRGQLRTACKWHGELTRINTVIVTEIVISPAWTRCASYPLCFTLFSLVNNLANFGDAAMVVDRSLKRWMLLRNVCIIFKCLNSVWKICNSHVWMSISNFRSFDGNARQRRF